MKDDHACQLRRRFETKSHAQTAAGKIANRTGKQRFAVSCQHCNGWHLGGSK